MPHLTIQQISEHVRGELVGPGDTAITGVNQLALAEPTELSFVRSPAFIKAWVQSRAVAALVSRSVDLEPDNGRAIIRVDDADLAMAAVLELFAPPPVLPDAGVHPTAVVDPSALIGAGVRIGPQAVVGPHAVVGDRAVLHPHACILADARLGADSTLWPGVVIRERCSVGDRSTLHCNVSIGADGFNYRPRPDGSGMQKIPHIGTVEIGDDVEIGANTCVDRGKFGATVIGSGTKIDNLCQIAHNCRVGRDVVIAGGCMIAGSVTIEDGVVIGGNASVRDHVTIGRGATIAAAANVGVDAPPGVVWGGYIAHDLRAMLKEQHALKKLPELVRKMRKLD